MSVSVIGLCDQELSEGIKDLIRKSTRWSRKERPVGVTRSYVNLLRLMVAGVTRSYVNLSRPAGITVVQLEVLSKIVNGSCDLYSYNTSLSRAQPSKDQA